MKGLQDLSSVKACSPCKDTWQNHTSFPTCPDRPMFIRVINSEVWFTERHKAKTGLHHHDISSRGVADTPILCSKHTPVINEKMQTTYIAVSQNSTGILELSLTRKPNFGQIYWDLQSSPTNQAYFFLKFIKMLRNALIPTLSHRPILCVCAMQVA